MVPTDSYLVGPVIVEICLTENSRYAAWRVDVAKPAEDRITLAELFVDSNVVTIRILRV